MRLSTWVLSAVLLLSDIVFARAVSGNVVSIGSRLANTDDMDVVLRRAAEAQAGGELEVRAPATAVGSTNAQLDAQVQQACMSAVSNIKSVKNAAGYAGCYNILQFDSKNDIFQADFRIYQQGPATGDFTDIAENLIMVLPDYPDIVEFKSVTKRSIEGLEKRADMPTDIKQYTFIGNFRQHVDVTKLNQTQIASLMVPQITLQATSAGTNKTISTSMVADDSAWFVAGQFTDVSADAVQVANPNTAAAAITSTQGFVIPGRTFGIFPTGLIVTSTWTVLFLLAFGLGTLGRLRSRDGFRRRVVGMTARGRI